MPGGYIVSGSHELGEDSKVWWGLRPTGTLVPSQMTAAKEKCQADLLIFQESWKFGSHVIPLFFVVVGN